MAAPSARLLIDDPSAGAWNMAADEFAGQQVESGAPATLRFYAWEPATLSLGYFQALADRLSHAPSQTCPVVRRQSGGGAILHDAELTYSFAAPAQGPSDRAARELYRDFHETLIEALTQFGVAAELCGDERCAAACAAQVSADGRSAQPFLCFRRRAREDVLAGDDKIAGSAQRRQRKTLVQHGSVLLARSRFAPELPGLAERRGSAVVHGALIEAWLPRLGARLGLVWRLEPWRDNERAEIARLAADKFESAAWTARR